MRRYYLIPEDTAIKLAVNNELVNRLAAVKFVAELQQLQNDPHDLYQQRAMKFLTQFKIINVRDEPK